MGSTFGATLSATNSPTLVMDVSMDGKAFTGTFADFQVEANNGAAASAPIAARWEWFVLPVADTPQGDSITVSVSGNVVTEDAPAAASWVPRSRVRSVRGGGLGQTHAVR